MYILVYCVKNACFVVVLINKVYKPPWRKCEKRIHITIYNTLRRYGKEFQWNFINEITYIK